MPHDIFVSYSRRDLAAVKPVKEELEKAGFSCWMDLDGIESGEANFKRKIVPALDCCKVVLFFISTDSQQSEWTAKELGYATRHGKRVIPLRFNDDPLVGEFDLDYGGSDIIDWRKPEQKEKLLRDLRKWTGKTPPSGPSVQTSGQGASSSRTGDLVECPVCGKKNRPEETFRCRECGRDNLCLRHQDEETFLCRDCVAKAKKKTSRDVASERNAVPKTVDPEDEASTRRPSGKANVFLSYSRRDLAAVQSIRKELESSGFSCWMDIDGIPSGAADFAGHVVDAIDGATVFLFFLSGSSQESSWALKEISYAEKKFKHVVVVRINDDPMTKRFRFELGQTNVIDWRKPDQKEKLLRNLAQWTNAPDVFLCYRRTGREMARRLQLALETHGRSVFFDSDSLREGPFEEQVFAAIDNCKAFVVLLCDGFYDRIGNKDNWTRRELERALAAGKKIIPVLPSDQCFSFPDELPPTLESLKHLQISRLDTGMYFAVSVDQIVKRCFG